jgi:hypothetical protein
MTTVDPYDIPKRMTKSELEWWILFGIAVAGKGAKQTTKKLNAFLELNAAVTPFGKVKSMIQYGELGKNLRKVKLGKYKLFNKAYRAAVNLDLDNISVEMLEQIPGIGFKTARMTILYYEPNAEVVPLDTHVLKWLKAQGYDAPKATPGSKKKYLELERAFVTEAKRRGLSVRELDTQVWKQYART